MSSRRSSKEGSKHELVPEKHIYTTWPEMIKHWPLTTLCIVANEFCERFSYYGMRTVLVMYLLNVLKFTEDGSNIFFNVFTILCYLTPMLGSIIADGYIGKFWTIFSVSILYAIGQVILAVASTKGYESTVHPAMDMAGLAIIALGTGGIKPCVSAFGGDQFDQSQVKMLSIYFSVFYFSINAGSMISTFITPIFRSMPCLGQDSCYPLSFGIPAILMIIATLVFMAGSFWYKKPPPKENIFAEVMYIMGGAIRNKFRKGSGSTPHWLDHYMDTHVCETDPKCIKYREEKGRKKGCLKQIYVDDIKSLIRLLVMFLPVPMFWALYNQQASVWLFQGIEMNCRVSDSFSVLPDQMQTLNAVLILVFIPLFQVIIYPICQYFFDFTPLRRMVAGGLLASLAFCITGFLQLAVNNTLPQLPGGGESYVSVWNQLSFPCDVSVVDQHGKLFTVSQNQSLIDDKNDNTKSTLHFDFGGKTTFATTLYFNYSCSARDEAKILPQKFDTILMKETKYYYIGVTDQGLYMAQGNPKKPTDGTGEYSVGVTMLNGYEQNFALCREAPSNDKTHMCNPKSPSDFYYWETHYNKDRYGVYTDDREAYPNYTTSAGPKGNAIAYTFKPVKPGKWKLYYLQDQVPKDVDQQTWDRNQLNTTDSGIGFEINEQGGVYVLAVIGNQTTARKEMFQFVGSNTVNILWQVPQIVVITAAEILFSITGYEFAYSQSAPSMKALVQALWLLTTAAGSAIIVLITALDLFDNMATEFFAYAIIMAVVIIIFALLSIFYYDYHYYTHNGDESEEEEEDEDNHSKWSEDDTVHAGKLRKPSLDPSMFDLKF